MYTFTYRVAGAMCIWILTAKAELVKDKVFLELLKEIQDCLAKDGLTEQLKALTTCLAESIKSSTTNLSASGSDLMPLKVCVCVCMCLSGKWLRS